jgi:hypothetical protein
MIVLHALVNEAYVHFLQQSYLTAHSQQYIWSSDTQDFLKSVLFLDLLNNLIQFFPSSIKHP